MKYACYFQISLLSGWEAFQQRHNLNHISYGWTMPTPLSTPLFVKYMLFFWVVVGLSQISEDYRN